MKNRDYKEDSTKGYAVPNPKTYKRDQFVQVWMQSRHLATLLKWFDNEGIMIRFKSELVREALEQVVEHLVDSGIVEMIEYAEDATEMLNSRFCTEKNPGDRGKRNITHNLILDNRRKGQQANQQYGQQSTKKVEESEEITPEMVAKATEIYKEKEEKELARNAKKELERAKSTMNVDKNGVMSFKNEDSHCHSGPVTVEEIEAAKEEKKEEKESVKAQGIVSRLENADIRVRSDEEILEDRIRKDKEQDRLLNQM